eukprot:1815972-Prymnesium_polylepis.3
MAAPCTLLLRIVYTVRLRERCVSFAPTSVDAPPLAARSEIRDTAAMAVLVMTSRAMECLVVARQHRRELALRHEAASLDDRDRAGGEHDAGRVVQVDRTGGADGRLLWVVDEHALTLQLESRDRDARGLAGGDGDGRLHVVQHVLTEPGELHCIQRLKGRLSAILGAAAHHRFGPAAKAQHEVERRLLLDVVVRERAAVLQLLAREDDTLLVGRDALLVLDLGLHVVN